MKAVLPKELHEALEAANRHIDEALKAYNLRQEEHDRLMKLSKEDVIEELLTLKFSKSRKRCINVEDLVYSILCDPKCAYLNYDMIASAIQSKNIQDLETKSGNIRWYASQGIIKGRDVVPRITQKAMNTLLSQIKVG